MRFWGATLIVGLCALAASVAAAPASAGWHYTFKRFIKASSSASSAGLTEVRRCAPGLAGDWRLRSLVDVEIVSPSSKPKNQSVEIEITGTMPITTKFRPVSDVDGRWEAKLPKDPGQAALLSEHYERLTESQSDFYEGMSVRWRPAKSKLDIRHPALVYAGNVLTPAGEVATAFKPQSGCGP